MAKGYCCRTCFARQDERPHYARGQCATCYHREYWRAKHGSKPRTHVGYQLVELPE
jgi:hypothetical protein